MSCQPHRRTVPYQSIAQDTPQLVLPIGHTAFVSSVAFSPDGRYALSGSGDSTLKLWEVSTGREVRTFSGHAMTVRSVAFSPDGRYALSGSLDKTLKLWEVSTGREVRSFSGYPGVVSSVAFSPDGQVKVRAFIDKRGLKAKQRMSAGAARIQEDVFADLRRGTGAVVISSSSGDEYSFESGTWKNGVFTYCVLKGLKEMAADRNKDRNILVTELQDYLIEQVQTLTEGGQNPTVRRENLENDFVVY